jgi:hypothetical protein
MLETSLSKVLLEGCPEDNQKRRSQTRSQKRLAMAMWLSCREAQSCVNPTANQWPWNISEFCLLVFNTSRRWLLTTTTNLSLPGRR